MTVIDVIALAIFWTIFMAGWLRATNNPAAFW